MNPDDFEQDLQRRPLRPVPAEWRADILRAAKAASPQQELVAPPSARSTLYRQLSSIFWPSPLAWAGLAAVWMVTAVFIYADSGSSEPVLAEAGAPSAELKLVLREQRRTLTQLMEAPEQSVAEPPKSLVPRPRGELKLETVIV